MYVFDNSDKENREVIEAMDLIEDYPLNDILSDNTVDYLTDNEGNK